MPNVRRGVQWDVIFPLLRSMSFQSGGHAVTGSSPTTSPRTSFRLVLAMLGMVAIPAALTLHTVRAPEAVSGSTSNSSTYGYTVSLLLFIVPILAIGLWLLAARGGGGMRGRVLGAP